MLRRRSTVEREVLIDKDAEAARVLLGSCDEELDASTETAAAVDGPPDDMVAGDSAAGSADDGMTSKQGLLEENARLHEELRLAAASVSEQSLLEENARLYEELQRMKSEQELRHEL